MLPVIQATVFSISNLFHSKKVPGKVLPYIAKSYQSSMQFENQEKPRPWKSILCWHSTKTRLCCCQNTKFLNSIPTKKYQAKFYHISCKSQMEKKSRPWKSILCWHSTKTRFPSHQKTVALIIKPSSWQ